MAEYEDIDARLRSIEREENSSGQERAFDIYVKNANSGNEISFYTKGENWLGQVFKATAKDLGLDINKNNNIYINEKNQSTTDPEMSIGEFGIAKGGVLTIQQDGKVAAR